MSPVICYCTTSSSKRRDTANSPNNARFFCCLKAYHAAIWLSMRRRAEQQELTVASLQQSCAEIATKMYQFNLSVHAIVKHSDTLLKLITTMKHTKLVGLTLVPALWLVLLISSPLLGVDFYPLYFAAQRTLAGQSPYGAAATAQLVQQWPAPFATAGIAYPLPFIVLVLPLALLPLVPATAAWTIAGLASAVASVRLARNWRKLTLLPFLFLPLHRSATLGQATLLWFGLAALLVLGIHQRRSWQVGVCAALLFLKPQAGALFAIAGLVWLLRKDRRGLLWFAGVAGGLGLAAFALAPDWLAAWLAQTQQYRAIVHPPSLLPWSLLLVLACWRQPWWTMVAAAQVGLFPLSDVYSALPLLFCWISVGGNLALAGASVSWLWSLAGLPNTTTVFWAVILVPLGAALLWRHVEERSLPRSTIARRAELAADDS